MSCDKCEEALAKARTERDFWRAEYERVNPQGFGLRTLVEELHTLVDPGWEDE